MVVAYFSGKPLTADSKPQGSVPPRPLSCAPRVTERTGVWNHAAVSDPCRTGIRTTFVRALEEYKKGGRKNPIMGGDGGDREGRGYGHHC